MSWTPLEFWANFFTVVCIYLAGRNNIHTWWTGIVACVLFMFLFFGVQLYADMILQVFFVITGIIGWKQWAEGKLSLENNSKIKEVEGFTFLRYSMLAATVAVVYGYILQMFTNAFAPFIDSSVLAFSVLAQLLLMAKIKETWLLWLVVNTIAVPLFWSRELYLTSVLYGFFWAHALWSYFSWKKLYKAQV
jgi:nicotinamide mononucleotide transporter